LGRATETGRHIHARRLCEEDVPLLIIHSTGDELVPVEHARRLKEACPKATFWRLEGYEHVGAYAHPQYRQRLLGFLRTSKLAESTYRGTDKGLPSSTYYKLTPR
jgi:pimeloyl-ACP methyl ester carboxylesterase